jgi:hypothetical protein
MMIRSAALLSVILIFHPSPTTSATRGSQAVEADRELQAAIRRIQAVEEQLANLQRRDRLTQVRAPFEVVDTQGRPIVRIEEWAAPKGGGVYVYNRQGHIAATLGAIAGQQGGKVTVLAGDGSTSVSSMFYLAQGSGIILGRGDGETGIEIDAARSELSILDKDGTPAVSLSATPGGIGRLKLAVEPK